MDICLDAGLTMFDSADAYSAGRAEEILGHAIKGRRDRVIISTKSAFRVGPGPNDVGSSRYHLIRAVEGSLRRLGTDYIDLYQLHAFDRTTPVEETLGTLDDLVRAGKIRYIGCSNFSGWHLMKSLAISKEYGLARYVAHQAYYSLIGRDYEWELMPLALDQGVGCVAWSPLGIRAVDGQDPPGPAAPRDQPAPPLGRDGRRPDGPRRVPVPGGGRPGRDRRGDGQDGAAGGDQLGAGRLSVSSAIIGARDEAQLRQNLGAVGWELTPEQIARLDAASETAPSYPTWHQRLYAERNPPAV